MKENFNAVKKSRKKIVVNVPALLLVELVAHGLGELLELALGLGIVALDHDVLEVPEPPGEVLKALALFEVARNF